MSEKRGHESISIFANYLVFLQNVGSVKFWSDFSQSLFMKMHFQENMNAQAKSFLLFCDMGSAKIEHKPW